MNDDDHALKSAQEALNKHNAAFWQAKTREAEERLKQYELEEMRRSESDTNVSLIKYELYIAMILALLAVVAIVWVVRL